MDKVVSKAKSRPTALSGTPNTSYQALQTLSNPRSPWDRCKLRGPFILILPLPASGTARRCHPKGAGAGPGPGSRGGGIAGSPGGRKVSVAPARRSTAERAKQAAGRAAVRSGRLRASACAAVPRLPGSPGHPAGPASPIRRPSQPQLRPPRRHREEVGRGGAGAHLFDQSTPLLQPRRAGLGRADPLRSRHPPLVSALAQDLGRATHPLPSTPDLGQATRPSAPTPRAPARRWGGEASAVSASPPGASVPAGLRSSPG